MGTALQGRHPGCGAERVPGWRGAGAGGWGPAAEPAALGVGPPGNAGAAAWRTES